jgi:TonB-linked SusC/RagA family outer membrane protein
MRKLILTLSTAFVFILHAAAQDRTVTGKVTNEKNVPVEGASVATPDGKYGTQTNKDGNFSIVLPANEKTLTVSYVNFESVTRSVVTATTVNISLKPVDSKLEEVVVVGYGTQQKRKATSAITKIDGSDIANLATTSFDKQLAGRAAGVQVNTSSGLLNAAPRIRIRGINSISQGRTPLFVIDGVPTFSGGNSGIVNTNVLSDINPADIESFDVLKDGAATAIYGSRGANGVIMITTKKGKMGKLSMNYDMYMGFNSTAKRFDLLNAQEFVTIANEKHTNAGQAPQAFLDANKTNTDWQSNVFRNNAFVQNHTVSLSAGTDKLSFYGSVNYLSQEGVVRTNIARRYALRANVEARVNPRVKMGINLAVTRSEDNDQNNGGNALGGSIAASIRALPNVPVYNSAGVAGYNIDLANPGVLGKDANLKYIDNGYTNVAFLLDKNKLNNDKYRIIVNTFLELTILKGLTFRTQGSADYLNSTDFLSYDNRHGDGLPNGRVSDTYYTTSRYTWQNVFNYNRTFRKHSVGATAGTEMQRDISKNFGAAGTVISDLFFIQENLISNSFGTQLSSGGFSKLGFQSFFGRVNYDYDNRYFIQGTIRRDGQTSLAKANRYGNFPGGSVGWRISNERFWRHSGFEKWINELKFRGSYAVVGNTLTGFPYLSTYASYPYAATNGLAVDVVGNPGLKWETDKKLDIGFDMSFAKNRINLTFDYFKNNNDDQVFNVPQAPSLGIPNNIITKNIGTMQNRGIEIALNLEMIRKRDFTWTVDLNYTSVTNKVLSLAPGLTEQTLAPTTATNNGTFNILRVGQPVNAFYGYSYAGVNAANGNAMYYTATGALVQYNNALTNAGYYYALTKNDPNLGAFYGASLPSSDRLVLGTAIPTWFGGLTNSFTYKRFSADIFLRFSGGNQVYNLTAQEALMSNGFINNSREILKRWTTPGQVTDVPKLWIGRDAQINLTQNLNSRFLEDGKYLKLQSVTFGYNLDEKTLEKRTNGYIKSFRFYVQGQNLFTWTGYKGIDPENISEQGIDNNTVPQIRSITAGINVGF